MPRAAYCSECDRYAWIAKDGGCVSGHRRSSLRGEQEMDQDADTGLPVVPSATSLEFIEPNDLKSALAVLRSGAVATIGSIGLLLEDTASRVSPAPHQAADESNSHTIGILFAAVAVLILCFGLALGATLNSGNGQASAPAATTTQKRARSSQPAASPTRRFNPGVPAIQDSHSEEPRKCILCNGQGFTECTPCRGTGRGSECFQCDGSGSNSSGFDCYSCDGLGHRPCSHCDSGHDECSSCDGSGLVF